MYVNRNVVGFRVRFKTLDKYVRRYKEAAVWYERLGMLGGIMGMLLGISIITGIDFLLFVFDYLCIGWREWFRDGYPSKKNRNY